MVGNNPCVLQYKADKYKLGELIYPEHNDQYLQECLDNLKRKGIKIRLK